MNLDEYWKQMSGMDPKADRLNLLPYPQGALTKGQPIDWTQWTAPQWLYDLGKAAVAPGHVAGGGSWTPDDAQNVAMNMFGVGGGGNLAAGIPENSLGMFGGKLAKGADLGAMEVAIKRLGAGDDPALVWKETGWAMAPDGQMRFEIPDNASMYRGAKLTNEGWSGDVIHHPGLFSEYPPLKDINVREIKGVGGSLSNDGSKMEIGFDNIGGMHDVALHELQHAVQSQEGFASGGSVEQFTKKAWQARRNIDKYLDLLRGSEKEAESVADIWMEKYPEKVEDAIKYLKSERLIDDGDVVDRDAIAFSITERDRVHQGWLQKWRDAMEAATTDPLQSYLSLAGEAEARQTQSRAPLTMAERLAQYPYDPEIFKRQTGVDIKDLIFRQ